MHEQTLALYRLLAEVRAAAPQLEIESCAGGGGWIDLGILDLAERVWASDCIDPLERQEIEAWTSLLLPPEMVGSHIASSVSHTTGRSHSLDFRAGTAFFGHLGIEWDLTSATSSELDSLRTWVQAHKTQMPMIDVYAAVGTFPDTHQLATDLALAVMEIEQVPNIPMFRENTAAFVHDLPNDALANVNGDRNHVRIQVLTNAGGLDRDKQLAAVSRLTEIVASAAQDPTLTSRTWVLLTEAVDGGWGLGGHANTNADLVDAARSQIAELAARGGSAEA